MFDWLKKWCTKDSHATSPHFEPASYQGFDIHPEPMAEGGQYRLHGRITRLKDGELQEYRLIRSDLLPSAEQAAELMIAKAKRVIDENGERIFD
ncbi:HlyU family transcriptional regulator [Oceanisphaera psychrotolerans]|uniref:Transcriptional regulator n=1 Tax=Oceanisphaera psychrotolerans TaxID=1414654 RepID=A0A1J4QER0_9GAMM|nr:HlyU family transcriptional regulator [Oceanisphaera psychrotolerans]OIN10419.1 transcriptional regulator [Oceanisphaera psychrotolerans]